MAEQTDTHNGQRNQWTDERTDGENGRKTERITCLEDKVTEGFLTLYRNTREPKKNSKDE